MELGRRWIWVAALLLAASGQAWGAEGKAPQWTGAREMMSDQMARLEQEIAQLMMQRPDAPAETLAGLEMGIDLRIISRWMLNKALAEPFGSDAQVAARLRSVLCQDATAGAERAIAGQPAKPTAAQNQAMQRLHQLTFALDSGKSPQDMDNLSRSLCEIVLALSGADGAAPALPRPKPLRFESAAATTQPDRPRTVAEMGEEARALNVSVGLRQQLLILTAAAAAPHPPSEDPGRKEAASLRATLGDALDLARALQANMGVAPEERVQLERQLAEGLALIVDPRTRASGQAKLAALRQYKQMVGRVDRLKLTPEQANQFSGLFVWVRASPREGPKAMAALGRYLQLRSHFDARPRPGASSTFRRFVDDLEKQFAKASADFVTEAQVTARAPSAAAANLEMRVEDVRRIVELLDNLDQMPAVLDRLASFKPRPAGALERRVLAAAMLASASTDAAGRAEATRLIADLTQLSGIAADLAGISVSAVPSGIEKRWTGGRLGAVDAKWRTTIQEITSAVAGGGDIDTGKLSRLSGARLLYDALQEAAAMDQSLQNSAPALAKWVDWRVTVDDLKPILLPYPRAMAEAYAGFVADDPEWMDQWAAAQRDHRPLMQLINRDAAYAQQCMAFPGPGLAATAAALLTPMDGAPFATERFLGFAADVYRFSAEAHDTAALAEAMSHLNRRLAGAPNDPK